MNYYVKGLLAAALTSVCATGAVAQTTTQQGVIGASGNAAYPLQVRGANGIVYDCRNALSETATGRPARVCVNTSGAAASTTGTGLLGAGTGVATGTAVAGLIGVALLISTLSSDDTTSGEE